MTPQRLLILGSSARAAAGSALRAGIVPVCGDMFGDEDLRAMADTHLVADYPRGLLKVAKAVPPREWLYTGALENSPQWVARISQRHRLLGNPPSVLKTVRNPFRVAEFMRRAGLPFLAVRRADDPPEPDGRWLLKPRRSGGGRGIRRWDPGAKPQAANFDHSPLTTHHSLYFQEFAAGTPIAAVFLASRLNCRLVGVTRQLVGEVELRAPAFAYCGSLGPLRLPGELMEQWRRIGRVLATECDLRGLFGVDAVFRDGNVLPVEVNPRYTASVEVLELATGRPLLGWHCRACESFDHRDAAAAVEAELSREWDAADHGTEAPIVGKAVLYSGTTRDLIAPSLDGILPPVELAGGAVPAIADIPQPGSTIPAGGPICTVFAAAGTVAECLNSLFDRVRTLALVYRL